MKTNKNSKSYSPWFMQRLGLVIFSMVTFLHPSYTQESITAAGGEATGTTGTVSFTVGQVFYHAHEGEGGTVAEGVQQPFEIFIITSVEDAPDITLNMMAYPNPVAGRLNLVVDLPGDLRGKGYHYRLYDANGRALLSDRILNRQSGIDMANLPPAVYFLHVLDNRQVLRVFRIIKN